MTRFLGLINIEKFFLVSLDKNNMIGRKITSVGRIRTMHEPTSPNISAFLIEFFLMIESPNNKYALNRKNEYICDIPG
jgi:hypothetical protein